MSRAKSSEKTNARSLATSAASEKPGEAPNVAQNATLAEAQCRTNGEPPRGPQSPTLAASECRTKSDIGEKDEKARRDEAHDPSVKKRGPRKFTEEARVRFCSALEFGLTREQSAAHIGVSRRTVERAMKDDRAFAERVLRAEQMCDVQPLLTIRKASQTSWRAAAWLLRHRRPHKSVREAQAEETAREIAEAARRLEEEGKRKG